MSVTFGYPWSGPTLTVELRDPEFQDKRTTTPRVSLRTMMDGSIRSRRKTPATVTLTLRFLNVTRNKAIEFHDFLATSQGTKLRFVDHEGHQWLGFVTTDPNNISTYAVGLGNSEPRKESNELDIEFEGVQVG